MASNQDSSKKTKRGPAQPWIVNSFGVPSPSSKPPKQQQRTLMSAPAFAISPRTGSGGGGGRSKSTRAGSDQQATEDQAETPVKKLRRDEAIRDGEGGDDPESIDFGLPGPSTTTRPHPLAQPTPLPPVKRPSSKPLTTTPSRHLPPPPPPPAYRLPRPSAAAAPGPSSTTGSKPLSRMSDLLPAPSPIKTEPSSESATTKKALTVGLSGIAAGKIRADEEEDGEGRGAAGAGSMGVDEWAVGMLSGKSPSKGKRAFKGILPLTSSTSLLLSSHSTSLKQFYTSSSSARRPPPDLHLLVLSVAPPEPTSNHTQLNPRLLRTTCRILPPPKTTSSSPPAATTTSKSQSESTLNSDPFALPPLSTNKDVASPPSTQSKPDEDDEMEEEESIGMVLLMLPSDGSLGVGRKEGVGVGKTVRGWRPWLEVEVASAGGERVLMLDRFEVE